MLSILFIKLEGPGEGRAFIIYIHGQETLSYKKQDSLDACSG